MKGMAGSGLHFGAAYYPEYWPRDRWRTDAQLMRAAGMDVVRIGEFAWRVLEPEEGVFSFELLDEAIRVLNDHGISVMLCTPTAAMPAWVQAKYPEVNVVDAQGWRRSWGARKNYCYTSPKYRDLSQNITRAMAEHYAGHPGVIAWQTDNEFGYNGCYCETCLQAFRQWLAGRYDTPEALSAAWGLRFWSMDIHSFGEMLLPTERAHNPAHMQEFRRFASDQVLAFNREQAEIIRGIDPQARVSHNYMTTYFGIDYRKMAQDLDFVSNDMYPRDITTFEAGCFGHDVIRGFNGGPGFWMTELQCGYINRESQLRTPPPGSIRLWTHQAIAQGADSIIYFRWRSSTGGCEQLHSGIVQHDGSPKSRSYREVVEIGKEVERLRAAGLAGSAIRNDAAILRGFDQHLACNLYYGRQLFDYDAELERYYRPLLRRNIGVDVVSPQDDLSGYRLVIAPLLIQVTPEMAEALAEYVTAGGTLVTSFRLGAYGPQAVITGETLPGVALGRLFGVEIHEYDSLAAPAPLDPLPRMAWDGEEYEASVWADCLEPTAAEVWAQYTNAWYAPYAAITANRVGQGQAIYVGATCGEAFYERFVPRLAETAGVQPVLSTPRGVAAKRRLVRGKPVVFLLNYTVEEQAVDLPAPTFDLLTQVAVGPRVTLAPRGVMALRLE